MSGMRAIDAESFKAPADFSPGGAPILQWIKIADLVVDDGYQRPIYGAGAGNVRRIVDSFCWSKFAPVIVAPVEGGKFAIIDGQHRTTAAAICGIESVPCQVVIASASEQAEAFRAINGQVTRIHALALQHAALQSGDEEALAVEEAARAGGVTIVRYPKQMLSAGETMALGTIRNGVREFDRETVITALRCFTKTSNHKPGVLKAMSLRAVIAVLASNIRWRDGGGRLLATFEAIDIDLELEEARLTRRPKGTATWEILTDRLRLRLAEAFGARAA